MKPLHAWSSYAGQTVNWISPDTKEAYQQRISDPVKRLMLQQFGWVDQHIDYTFNSDGFRTDEFDDRPNFVTIGCS
jgi:protoheme ferro-lyase